MCNSSSALKAPLMAWARPEGASGSSTQPFWLGDVPRGWRKLYTAAFLWPWDHVTGHALCHLFTDWAISLGYFQVGGSRLTLLISGKAGKPEQPEHPDPGSPPVGQGGQDSGAAENGGQRGAHPAPATLPRTVMQARTAAR